MGKSVYLGTRLEMGHFGIRGGADPRNSVVLFGNSNGFYHNVSSEITQYVAKMPPGHPGATARQKPPRYVPTLHYLNKN